MQKSIVTKTVLFLRYDETMGAGDRPGNKRFLYANMHQR